jgi:parallel beta-helix repeat protein
MLASVCLLNRAAGAEGATIYVRQSGDDTAAGSSSATALRTIAHAAAMAKPFDRVVVGPGTYTEGDISLSPNVFGHVSFVADRRGTETKDAAGDVVLDGHGFSTGFTLNSSIATTVDGFVISGAAIGVYVKSQSVQATVSNCVVTASSGNAIYIQDSDNVTIFNCLVYDNARSGILVTGNVTGSAGVRVINNTVYGNGDRGIFFSGSTIGSPGGLVVNNVMQGNFVAGLQVNPLSRPGFLSAGNIWDRYASGTPVDVTDVRANPLFVDSLGRTTDPSVAHTADDFHLSQAAAGQAMTSPAVNAGSDIARRLALGRASTRTDRRGDCGWVDAGYHYGNFSSSPDTPFRLRSVPIYVSPSGSDLNDGRTPVTALQSLARALQLATPGNRVVLLSGIFKLDPTAGEIAPLNSGKPSRPIIVQALAGAVIDATGLQRGLSIVDKSNIALIGLDVANASDSGIAIRRASSDITVQECHLHNNRRRGLFVSGSSHIILRSSFIEHNGTNGLQVEAADVNVVRTSIVENGSNGVWALNHADVTVSDSQVVGNTVNGVLGSQSQLAIVGGAVRGSKDGGVRVAQGSTGTLMDVDVSDNTDVGVQGISSTVSISGGTIRNNTRVGVESIVDAASGGATSLSVTGTQICANHGPGLNAQSATVTLTDVTLCENSEEGLRQSGGSVVIQGATVEQNQAKGIAVDTVASVTIQNATVDRNRDNGVQVLASTLAQINDAVVSANGGNGVTVLDSPDVTIVNNLVFSNLSTGILISGTTTGSPRAQVLNNTIYGNSNRGLLIGGSNDQPPSRGAQVFRNIFQANAVEGIQVNQLSLLEYVGDYNLNRDSYFTLTPVGLHDILSSPMIVDPAHGDFHLMQRTAGQAATSPAVDAGDVDVTTAGLAGTSTRTDWRPDTGPVDLGYHYRQ